MMKSQYSDDEELTLFDEEGVTTNSHIREKLDAVGYHKDPESWGPSYDDDDQQQPSRKRRKVSFTCCCGPRFLRYLKIAFLCMGINLIISLIWVSSQGPRTVSLKEWLANGTGRSNSSKGVINNTTLTKSFRDALLPDQKYLTGFIIMGWTNDVMSYLHLIQLALLSNRIPILGPFQPSHVGRDGGYIPTGQIFDIPRLSEALHTPILEWHQVKNTTKSTPNPSDPKFDDYYGGDVEELGCWSVWMTQWGRGSRPRDGFIPEAIGLDISYTPVPYRHMVPDEDSMDYNIHYLAELGFKEGRRKGIQESKERYISTEKEKIQKVSMAERVGDVPEQIPLPNKAGHQIDPDDHLLCFDFLYHTATHQGWEWWVESTPAWQMVGRHMHWSPSVLQMAHSLLSTAFSLPPSAPFPTFISIHIRRNDFIDWCGGVVKDECLAPLEAYKRRVDQVTTVLLAENEGLEEKDIKVIVLSDEPRDGLERGELWWDKVRKLGWASVDHEAEQTAEKYGLWYPAVLDACMLSLANGFVGTYRSTYSLLAKRRVEEWAKGPTKMVNWGTIGADDHFED